MSNNILHCQIPSEYINKILSGEDQACKSLCSGPNNNNNKKSPIQQQREQGINIETSLEELAMLLLPINTFYNSCCPTIALFLPYSGSTNTSPDSPFVRQSLGAALTLAPSRQTDLSAPGDWSNRGEAWPTCLHCHMSVPWQGHRLESSSPHPQGSLGTASAGTPELPGYKKGQRQKHTS